MDVKQQMVIDGSSTKSKEPVKNKTQIKNNNNIRINFI